MSAFRDSFLTGTISRGLELLHVVHFKIKDHEQLVSVMQANICFSAGSFLDEDFEALGETAQLMRRDEKITEKDWKQRRRDPLPFIDDVGTGPPLAWTLIWGGTYSNLFGIYIPQVYRCWGYVMWDAGRLKNSGGEEALALQWDNEYDDRDDVEQTMAYRRDGLWDL